MELDIWIPERQIAFEYQGQQHYHDMEEFTKIRKTQSPAKDMEKNLKCKQNGIHLVSVPYWWDSSLASLKEILKEENVS